MTRTIVLAVTAILALAACSNAPDPQEQADALLSIAERGDISALDTLLGADAEVNVRNDCHWTPLMKAAVNGHRAAVSRLLDAGATVDAADKGGYTALMLAASNNHADVVELLLNHGAMIDVQEKTQGFTPLIWAAKRGHRETVELLLRRGADTTLPDFEAMTAAQRAKAEGHGGLYELLANHDSLASARS